MKLLMVKQASWYEYDEYDYYSNIKDHEEGAEVAHAHEAGSVEVDLEMETDRDEHGEEAPWPVASDDSHVMVVSP